MDIQEDEQRLNSMASTPQLKQLAAQLKTQGFKTEEIITMLMRRVRETCIWSSVKNLQRTDMAMARAVIRSQSLATDVNSDTHVVQVTVVFNDKDDVSSEPDAKRVKH
jgi:hypothetical protein